MIDQCSEGTSGCDSENGYCNSTNNGEDYICGCKRGYILFTEDGLNGHNISSSETGMTPGDVYYLNHTCVRKFDWVISTTLTTCSGLTYSELKWERIICAPYPTFTISMDLDNMNSLVICCSYNLKIHYFHLHWKLSSISDHNIFSVCRLLVGSGIYAPYKDLHTLLFSFFWIPVYCFLLTCLLLRQLTVCEASK